MKVLILLFSLLMGTAFASNHNIKVEVKDGDKTEEYLLEGKVQYVSVTEDIPQDYATGERPTRKLTLKEAQDKEKKWDIEWKIDVQYGTAEVVSNLTQVPNDASGTQFDLPEGSADAMRIYLSSIINKRHEIRLLFAPLEYEATFVPDQDILFNGVQFLAGKETTTGYKFNSYRLSYIYHFDRKGRTQYRIGFTGKIRDAYTLVRQDGKESKFDNVGFVPLLHLGVNILLTEKLSIDAEIEGSWAPQGWAVDFRTSLDYKLNDTITLKAGVGYLGGGADVDDVETFADILFGFVGVEATF